MYVILSIQKSRPSKKKRNSEGQHEHTGLENANRSCGLEETGLEDTNKDWVNKVKIMKRSEDTTTTITTARESGIVRTPRDGDIGVRTLNTREDATVRTMSTRVDATVRTMSTRVDATVRTVTTGRESGGVRTESTVRTIGNRDEGDGNWVRGLKY